MNNLHKYTLKKGVKLFILLTKTRVVPLSKEKHIRNPEKLYFKPTCYSSVKKSGENVSRFYKNKDAV